LFLPWHRAYLIQFERICRKLSGMQDFALPYWDWSTSPKIPAAYFEAGSPLSHLRGATASSVADAGSVGPAVLTPILNDANFLTFASGAIAATDGQRTASVQGPLESSPHNHIHNFVGGDMSSFMSPLDPIFWAHHGMIDRCWVDWNIVRNHANTSDSAWTDRKFTEFCDENGNPVEISVISAVLMPIFNYQYDAPIGGGASSLVLRSAAEERRWQEDKSAQVKVGAKIRSETLSTVSGRPDTVPLGQPVTLPLGRATLAAASSGSRTLLQLDGTSLNHTNDFFVRVFVNKPDADASTPVSDPHLLATFSFFTHNHGGAPERGSFVFDASSTLERLGRPDGDLNLTIVLVPLPGRTPLTQSFQPGVVSLRSVRETIATP
jgi:tyrosinase